MTNSPAPKRGGLSPHKDGGQEAPAGNRRNSKQPDRYDSKDFGDYFHGGGGKKDKVQIQHETEEFQKDLEKIIGQDTPPGKKPARKSSKEPTRQASVEPTAGGRKRSRNWTKSLSAVARCDLHANLLLFLFET